VVNRRALLGAGAAGAGALLAGCGPPNEPAARRADVLGEQLRLTRLVVAAYAGQPALRSRAQERVKRLEAAGAKSGTPASGPSGPQAAYDAERRALAAHVAAIGSLRDRASRELLGSLVADAAAGEATLARMLDLDPLATAFPGQPA
jgi:hypothetical protein